MLLIYLYILFFLLYFNPTDPFHTYYAYQFLFYWFSDDTSELISVSLVISWSILVCFTYSRLLIFVLLYTFFSFIIIS